mmetsp:Transcript_118739/g.236527  ORF Transcript_118739/g.236527 Transcript_118739/m.236527 type:complete len:949 (-) Transcript_118739:121-2967(-)
MQNRMSLVFALITVWLVPQGALLHAREPCKLCSSACSRKDSAKAEFPLWRQSPVELLELWDANTLASFSLSQLDAFAQIHAGCCPLLSRAIQCNLHGGQRQSHKRDVSRQGKRGRKQRWRQLTAAYLEEEADLARRQAVAMMRHVWVNYESRAWGMDELRPLTGEGTDSWGGLGQTMVDSLDTLWLMGLREEFERTADWVEQSLRFDKDVNVNLFETSIRQLGGLISAYALSERPGMLAKARDLGDRLIVAFGVRPMVHAPIKRKAADKKSAGILGDLMRQMGLSESALETVLGPNEDLNQVTLEPAKPTPLPYSDVNLGTGEVQNLANFVSLSEAYVPIEWKALALFTGNCTYVVPQEKVLRVVNQTAELDRRGLAPILLKPDGNPFPSTENRISMGSRGDSFYEYLLKDIVWSGDEVSPLTKRLWTSFREQLPTLLVEANPLAAMQRAAESAPKPVRSRKRRRRQSAASAATEGATGSPPPQPGAAAALGGWFETWRDVGGPWLFLKEIGYVQSIPKMDHLVCFLPGVLALDVLRHGGAAGNVSALRPDRLSELLLGHKLAQTCVHMYFRTVSDMAPEITRFNARGLVDDRGSMHNILRPETIESLMLLWRTTKGQIYRNWGQRMLAAFARLKTQYGFASLHNVNRPWERRNDMPSFFLAETMKYFFLLFSGDDALSLHHTVLSTEAHPLPTLESVQSDWGVPWLCRDEVKPDEARAKRAAAHEVEHGSEAATGVEGKEDEQEEMQDESEEEVILEQDTKQEEKEAEEQEVEEMQNEEGGEKKEAENESQQEVVVTLDVSNVSRPKTVADLQDGSVVNTTSTENSEVAATSLLGSGSGCGLRERRIRDSLVITERELQRCTSTLASLQGLWSSDTEETRPLPPAPARSQQSLLGLRETGDPTCWAGAHTPQVCCWPPRLGNRLCWDGVYTYARCCTGPSARNTSRS